MRTLITHDAEGNILAVMVPALDVGDQLEIVPQQGEIVSEVDVPSMKQVTQYEEQVTQYEEINRIVRDSRVDLDSGRPRLVRKAEAGRGDPA